MEPEADKLLVTSHPNPPREPGSPQSLAGKPLLLPPSCPPPAGPRRTSNGPHRAWGVWDTARPRKWGDNRFSTWKARQSQAAVSVTQRRLETRGAERPPGAVGLLAGRETGKRSREGAATEGSPGSSTAPLPLKEQAIPVTQTPRCSDNMVWPEGGHRTYKSTPTNIPIEKRAKAINKQRLPTPKTKTIKVNLNNQKTETT